MNSVFIFGAHTIVIQVFTFPLWQVNMQFLFSFFSGVLEIHLDEFYTDENMGNSLLIKNASYVTYKSFFPDLLYKYWLICSDKYISGNFLEAQIC